MIVQRAGDVIPEIVQVVSELRPKNTKPFSWPKVVEGCGGDGFIERVPGEAAWRCVDKNSGTMLRRKLYHFVSKGALDIEGCGPKTIDLLMDEGLLSSYADLFTLTAGDLEGLPGFAELAAKNVVTAIQAKKKVPLDRFLIALSIDHVGEETARDIAEHFGTLEKIRSATTSDFMQVQGVGEVVALSLESWFEHKDHKKTLNELLKQITVSAVARRGGGKLTGQSFVITGTLSSMSRETAEARVRELGGSTPSSVSKKTSSVS